MSDVSRREALAYLLGRDVLWNTGLRPESVLLMARLWPNLAEDDATTLIDAVLAGPPASGRNNEQARRDDEIAMRLMVLEREPRPLPLRAEEALRDIRSRRPGSLLSGDGREVFPAWTNEGRRRGRADADDTMPEHGLAELKGWLLDASGRREGKLDEWRAAVTARPGRGVTVLRSLAADDLWPIPIWRETLLGLDKAAAKTQAFRRVAPLLITAPETFLRDAEAAWSVGWWLPGIAAALPSAAGESFWEVWDHLAPRFLAEADLDSERDPLTAALNLPAGRLAEALIWRWSRSKPRRATGIEPGVGRRARLLLESGLPGGRIARVMLSRNLSGLFANDPNWARQNVLPRFAWSDPPEAAGMWRGFLAGGPVDPSLLAALLPDFLDTVRSHAKEIYRSEGLVWQLFMVACLEMPGTIGHDEARALLSHATVEARREAAHYIYRLMPQGKPDRAAALWRERIGPWLSIAWPKDKALRDGDVAASFAMAATLSGDAFPEALVTVAPHLVDVAGRSMLWRAVREAGLAQAFPRETFSLLAATATFEKPIWHLQELPFLLAMLQEADPALATDPRMRAMQEGLTRLGL